MLGFDALSDQPLSSLSAIDAGGSEDFNRLSTRDLQYEALLLTGGRGTTRDMEQAYWLGLFDGSGSVTDILYEGIVTGLGMQDLKEYYDTQTNEVWVDLHTSEKAYWLKIITDNT